MGGLALGGCSGDTTFNYRLSVSVRVGAQTVAGSNVRRLRWDQGIKQLGFMDVSRWKTHGEATLVDLGPRGLLIATLAQKLFSPEISDWYVASGLWTPVPAFTRAFGPDFSTWPRRTNQPVVLLPGELPLLITFRNPSNPRSVVEVPPGELSNEFGAGVSLDQVTVEVTRAAPIRGGIETALPWLRSLGESPLPGGRIGSRELYDSLAGYHFKSGS